MERTINKLQMQILGTIKPASQTSLGKGKDFIISFIGITRKLYSKILKLVLFLTGCTSINSKYIENFAVNKPCKNKMKICVNPL